jgi:hypothetical protein
MKRLAIVALALATAMTSVSPVQAFPTVPTPEAQASDIQNVQQKCYGGYCPRYEDGSPWPGRIGRRYNRRWDDDRRYSRRWDDRRYYRHRYRHYRDDDDDDFGAALGGFAAGAIIGGLLTQPRTYAPAPRVYYGGNSHTSWCYSRYRSYRAYDNTYQPYYGPRRQCISLYM